MTVPTQSFAQIELRGQITNPEGIPLGNVSVVLSGSENEVALTDADGNFQFTVPTNGTYTITPKNNTSPTEGISTLDLVLLERHIQGIALLDNPYKILAADVNNDLIIDPVDFIDLENLILSGTLNFPNNTSWRFVDADQVFQDPTNPLGEVVIQSKTLSDVQSNITDLDFVGIKVGDLNCSAITFLIPDPCNIGCAELSGKINIDQNFDCIANDSGLVDEGWIVEAKSSNDTIYAATNFSGEYQIELPEGDYEVTAFPKNGLWIYCANNINVNLSSGQSLQQNFLTQAVDECHLLSVDLGYSILRRCFSTPASINYCNDGTTTAYDLKITVTLDSLQMIESSSVPFSSQNGNEYTFEVDSLEANSCETIILSIAVSCDAVLDQTLCATTEITPFSDCLPPSNWDGSDFTVDAQCEGDSVFFTILNTGTASTKSVDFIIIEDDMIMMIDNSGGILQPQESITIAVPANGSTWRIEVNQSENHPFMEKIATAIEGCGTDSNGEISRGFINQFPLITNSKSISMDCATIVGSFDPNDKAGIPIGAHEEHFIEQNTNLEYLIRFQNTGTDTAFTVVIRDTLSEHLDITTIVPNASSHFYRFGVFENNIIEFTFPNIMLPDSLVNQAASQGFVKFEIAQQVDNPIGTRIENSSGIFFDFNEPVITNTTFHTIGENFLDIVNQTITAGTEFFEITVAPNPMNDIAFIEVEGKTLVTGSLELFDLNGRFVSRVDIQEQQFIIERNNFPSGMYFFKILENGLMISSGKLMITD